MSKPNEMVRDKATVYDWIDNISDVITFLCRQNAQSGSLKALAVSIDPQRQSRRSQQSALALRDINPLSTNLPDFGAPSLQNYAVENRFAMSLLIRRVSVADAGRTHAIADHQPTNA